MGTSPMWKQFDELDRWRREVDRRLAEMLHGARTTGTAGGFVPAVESFVKEGNLIIRVYAPGLAADDVELTVLDNVLTIKGERKGGAEVTTDDYLHREITYGSFARRLTLPRETDADKIQATFKNGVIELTMPMAKAVAAKKITLAARTPTDKS
jgi:HSP20 family protein